MYEASAIDARATTMRLAQVPSMAQKELGWETHNPTTKRVL